MGDTALSGVVGVGVWETLIHSHPGNPDGVDGAPACVQVALHPISTCHGVSAKPKIGLKCRIQFRGKNKIYF